MGVSRPQPAMPPSPASLPVARTRPRRRSRREAWTAAAFLAPTVVVLAVLRVFPMGEAFRLSFTNWDGFSSAQWVGLDNYRALAEDPVFLKALVNNGLLLLSVPLAVAVPLVIAITLFQRPPGWRVFRAAFFIPAVLSPVIIGSYYEIALRLNGPLNGVLDAIGLADLSRAWLSDPTAALPIVGAVLIWSSFGIGVLIFLAALAGVNPELYDAARTDGASTLQTHRHVTLPAIRPVIEFYSVIAIISLFTVLFPYVFTLTAGGPGYSTYVLEFDIYQEAFQSGRLGYASAMGVVLFVVVLILCLVQMRLFRRGER